MAFFDEFGAAELLFVGGLCFAMCLVVLLLVVLYFRRHGTVVVLELDGVSMSYEGSIRTVQVSDLLADGRHGFDLLKRINSTLQLNSTYHDLSVFKNWDSPETSTQLDPRALLSTFLGEDDLRRAKTVPLLVERERFNVTGAFPWLYPVVHRDSLVSVAPGRSSCFGIAIGARVRKIVAPFDHMPHRSVVGASHSAGAPEGYVIATDVQGMAKVRWCGSDGHFIASTPTPCGDDAAAAAAAVQQQLQQQPLETWEYWGRGGHFTITPADISIGVPPPTTAGDLSALRFASAAAAAAGGGSSHRQYNVPSARHSPSTQHLTPAGVASGHGPRTLSGLLVSAGGTSQVSRHTPQVGGAGVLPSVSTQPPSSGLSSTTDTTQSSTGPSTVRQDTAASAVSSTTTATTSSTRDSRSQSRSSSATRTASRSSVSKKKAAAATKPASRRSRSRSSSSSSSSGSRSDSSGSSRSRSQSSSSRSSRSSSRSQSSSSRSTRRTRSGKSSKSSRNLDSRGSSSLRTSRGDSSQRARTATGTEQTVSSLSATTDTLRQ
eukprot:Rhum_TRINITY_DN14549_c3_g1::Rhum_TRINITY_DN14549_c3_g1_i1::g.98761::m.98761